MYVEVGVSVSVSVSVSVRVRVRVRGGVIVGVRVLHSATRLVLHA